MSNEKQREPGSKLNATCWACSQPIADKAYGVGVRGSIHWECYDKIFPPAAPAQPVPPEKTGKDFLNMFLESENLPKLNPVLETVVLAAMAQFAQYRLARASSPAVAPTDETSNNDILRFINALKEKYPMKTENNCKQNGHNFCQIGKFHATEPTQIFCTKCGEVRKVPNAK